MFLTMSDGDYHVNRPTYHSQRYCRLNDNHPRFLHIPRSSETCPRLLRLSDRASQGRQQLAIISRAVQKEIAFVLTADYFYDTGKHGGVQYGERSHNGGVLQLTWIAGASELDLARLRKYHTWTISALTP